MFQSITYSYIQPGSNWQRTFVRYWYHSGIWHLTTG